MQRQTRNWLLFTIGWYIIMFILVPPKKGPKVSPFGFYLGFIQAIVLNWLAIPTYKLWRFPGDILISGIPLFTSLSWIPPTIIFAYFFPFQKKLSHKIAYITFFATGTTFVQYLQGLIGMWESKNWKTIYTFPLAMVTHTIMALSLPLFNLKDIREN